MFQLLEEIKNTHTCSVTIYKNNSQVFTYNEDNVLPSASMGKIFILGYLSQLIEEDKINPHQYVQILSEDIVEDSGILQHLSIREYSYNDLATLVATVSDNSATNTLIRVLGLENIQKFTKTLNIKHSNILDRIRDVRNPEIHAYAPSEANSKEYAYAIELFRKDNHVPKWLSKNTDLSMVASAFNFDPLSHYEPFNLWNKTGTDYGIRCDAGNITFENNNYTYAVFTKFDESVEEQKTLTYDLMKSIGEMIKTL